MADTDTSLSPMNPMGYVPYENAGETPNLGFCLMAFKNSMADQAALNNENWIKMDELSVVQSLTPSQTELVDYATRIAILEHSLNYQAAWIDDDGTLNLVLQDSTWVPLDAEEVEA